MQGRGRLPKMIRVASAISYRPRLLQCVCDASPRDKFHRQIVRGLVLANLVDGDDVGVVALGGTAGFTLKSL